MDLEKEVGRDTAPAETDTRVERTETRRDENPNRDIHPRDQVAGKEKGKDIRSLARAAMAEVKEKAAAKEIKERDGSGRFAPTQSRTEDRGAPAAASPTPEPASQIEPGETAPVEAPTSAPAVAAPAALSKDVKAIWDTLPDPVKAEFIKREADSQKGVEQLKAKYKPLDEAFAPVQGLMQSMGKTPAQVVQQLLGWHHALAGPDKAAAFKALAQSHGFDLSTLAPQAPGVAPQIPTDPNQILRPFLDPLNQKLTAVEAQLQRQAADRVQNDIAMFSKDKPHFAKVSNIMGHLMQAGIAQGANPKEVFDDAYERACRADPETFALIQQEAQEKQEAEARAAQEAAAKKAADEAERKRKADAEAVEKARRAGVGPRGGPPTNARPLAGQPRGQSVRETLTASIKGAGPQI